MTSALEHVTDLIKRTQDGNMMAWSEFVAMHAEFKPFQNWTEPTLSNARQDWALRIPADIRKAFTEIQGRVVLKSHNPDIQARSDEKLMAAVAHWCERYDALVGVRSGRQDVEIREGRITANTLREWEFQRKQPEYWMWID